MSAPRRTSARLARHLLAVYASAVLRAPRLGPGERRELAARFARDARRPRGPAPRARDSTRGGTGAGSRQSRVLARHVRPQRGRRRTLRRQVGVRGWPFFGTIAARFDTFFIVRGSYRDAARTRTAVAHTFREGERVAVFPEGTTTDGATVGRFYPALFQAAIDSGACVQPAALRYRDAHGRRSPAPIFVGDTTLLASVARVVREPALSAEVAFGPP